MEAKARQMTLADLEPSQSRFSTSAEMQPRIKAACMANADVATYYELGKSEAGRPIYGVVLGSGAKVVTLIAGAHADEPVGPETLRHFILSGLQHRDSLAGLFARVRFVVVPHINPDGEARNQVWIKAWPSIEAYLQHVFREPPGRDLEFGFPQMRQENSVVSEFMRAHAPVCLHMSLHGMGFSEGVMLLLDKHWLDRTKLLRQKFARFAEQCSLPLHDHDRKGDKGFQYIGPGFTTTPEGEGMRVSFRARGDEQTARLFHDSSMEFVHKLGGEPLCVVTELPLFLIRKKTQTPRPGVPAAYLEFKEKLLDLRAQSAQGKTIDETLREFRLQPLDLHLQMRLQLYAVQLALESVL